MKMQLIKRPKIQLKCPLNRTDCQTVRLTVELVNPANLADMIIFANLICNHFGALCVSARCGSYAAYARFSLAKLSDLVNRQTSNVLPQQAACNMAYVACIFMLLPDSVQFFSQPKLIAARTETFVKHFNNH